jgi:FkbM family methyltransferase
VRARPKWFFREILRDIKRPHSSIGEAVHWLDNFFQTYPIRSENHETRDILHESLRAGLLSDEMRMRISKSARRILSRCRHRTPEFEQRHHGLDHFAPEVFCSGHFLETLDPRILSYIKPKVALDVGGFVGDSTLIFMDYSKEVYSFEPNPTSFQVLQKTIALNTGRFGTAYAIPLALSDSIRETSFPNLFYSAANFNLSRRWPRAQVNVTTLDHWMSVNSERNLSIGILKCDTEGHGLEVLKGGIETVRRDRPLLLLALYHCFSELFGIREFLDKNLPDYEYGMDFGTEDVGRLHELLLIGYPRSLLATNRTT